MAIVALLSDFGTHDWFVAEMKGVILSIAPESVIIDITHEITPGDIRSAAFSLLSCVKSFPKKTIFCIAVDPGTSRNTPIVIAKTDDYTFVSPDNGVVSFALAVEKNIQTNICSNTNYFKTPSSSTFRGRDMIASVAAYCSQNINLEHFGPVYELATQLALPPTTHAENSITSEIIYIDHFGNCITGIKSCELKTTDLSRTTVTIANHIEKIYVVSSYDNVPPGRYLLYPGSAGFLEIATNRGDIAKEFTISVGDTVVVSFNE